MTEELQDLTLEEALAPDDKPDAPATGAEPEAEDTTEAPQAAAEETPEAEDPEKSSTPEEPSSDDFTVPGKALLTEREKRQAAERERDELRKQLEAQTREDEPKTSVFEDESKWRSELEQEFDLKRHNDRYDMSQALAEDKWGAEKVTAAMEQFKTLAESNPQLGARVFEARLPYFEMMRIVDEHEQAKELENIDEFREKIRAEEREKIRKELEEEADAKAKKREGLTPSLASARSAGSGTEDAPPRIEQAEEVFPE